MIEKPGKTLLTDQNGKNEHPERHKVSENLMIIFIFPAN